MSIIWQIIKVVSDAARTITDIYWLFSSIPGICLMAYGFYQNATTIEVVLLFVGGFLLIPVIAIAMKICTAPKSTQSQDWAYAIEPNLKIIVSCIVEHLSCSIKPNGKINHPTLIEVETTFIPNKPIQIARLYMERSSTQLELLGPPIYAETMELPYLLKMEQTFQLRFKIDDAEDDDAEDKGKKEARLVIFASGQYWYSNYFSV